MQQADISVLSGHEYAGFPRAWVILEVVCIICLSPYLIRHVGSITGDFSAGRTRATRDVNKRRKLLKYI
jgi:hypothetical protein